ncbi:hypothetical protein CHS0354_005205 [Potamilus streckersoni]|uniref:Uncharacterized protein n=1 Tax=Potamilus streckersoni TaxID=2493646 RepID=A0AAE0VPP7_9BIVA|nr:hypothetical protein CHS0354_005205 [Potamilus streckersoni]
MNKEEGKPKESPKEAETKESRVQHETEARCVTAIIIGAGQRGHGYSSFGTYYPSKFKVVGVCDPREYHRYIEVQRHNITNDMVFTDWKEVATRGKLADCVIICTPDKFHKDPAIAFAKQGYHILLEKPMAVTEEDCREIIATCKENNIILAVCHVLRYTPWCQKVKSLIDTGVIGDVVNINHTEPVGYWHFAHSFVRGNWCSENESTFSLLAKCCHDFDLICCWMGDQKCTRVSSFGNLSHFGKEDKPKGSASRCLDCPEAVESNCPYSAKKIYLDHVKEGYSGWPVSVITDVVDIENVTKALRIGPYGRCVYESDNDVMSHQVVNMQFEKGQTATLQMVAFTKRLCSRETKIYGTKGEITIDNNQTTKLEVFSFVTGKTECYKIDDEASQGMLSGHGGADYHLIETFVSAVAKNDPSLILTGPDDTLASHLLVFAAEKSRKENRVVTMGADGSIQ